MVTNSGALDLFIPYTTDNPCDMVFLLQYFMRIGVGAAKFAGCFLLFYLPLDNMYCSLRQKVSSSLQRIRCVAGAVQHSRLL